MKEVYTPKNGYGPDDPEKRNSLKKIGGIAAALTTMGIVGCKFMCDKLEKLANEPENGKKQEIVGTVIEIGYGNKFLNNDSAKDEGYASAVIKDSTGIRYLYRTYRSAQELLKNVKRGDKIRLIGAIEDSDLEKAAKDKTYIVPVRNAGIRTQDGSNPLWKLE